MKCVTMLGDYLSEAQLRTLVRDYQVEQKYGYRQGSPAPKRKSGELSGVDAVRERVRNYRQRKRDGRLPVRPYVSQEDAIARYERRGERLESREQMFAIGQGQSTRKHTDIRATAIKGGRPGHGGRISKRPTIDEGRGGMAIRITSERKDVRRMVGYLV